jgi:hypothetical protein
MSVDAVDTLRGRHWFDPGLSHGHTQFDTFGSLLSVMELSSEKYVDFVEEHSWPSGLRED